MELVAYRWADYDSPFWASPNRSPGRFHREGTSATQYWSSHPLGPWAELLRAQGIRTHGDLDEIRNRVWAARIDLEPDTLAEVRFDEAQAWGLSGAEALISDDWDECQDLGERIRDDHSALVVPSAALPGTETLVLFGPRALAPYPTAPIDVEVDVPASVAADGAQPPSTLLRHVRWRGEPHPEHEAWTNGDPFPALAPTFPLRA